MEFKHQPYVDVNLVQLHNHIGKIKANAQYLEEYLNVFELLGQIAETLCEPPSEEIHEDVLIIAKYLDKLEQPRLIYDSERFVSRLESFSEVLATLVAKSEENVFKLDIELFRDIFITYPKVIFNPLKQSELKLLKQSIQRINKCQN